MHIADTDLNFQIKYS